MIYLIDSILDCLKDNGINKISIGPSNYRDIAEAYGAYLDVITVTLDFNRSPVAHLFGFPIYLNISIINDHFKYGIEVDNKIHWSIPISFDISVSDLNKMIKLKNYW